MPKGADNTTLILGAAREQFLEHGYGATTMDAVALAAGVSKATVYSHFGSKGDLFAAVVEREGEQQTVGLQSPPGTDTFEVLRAFGREAADLLLSDSVVAFQRIVASEATRTPNVGRLFYVNGPQRLIEGLATFLRGAMERGDLRAATPRVAAAQFLAIIVGDLQLRALMGLSAVDANEREEIVASGVEMFLRGYTPERPRPRSGGRIR
jgi:TetR/AcrR family transcriptional regulator, mexJK operon transcriptional repressor